MSNNGFKKQIKEIATASTLSQGELDALRQTLDKQDTRQTPKEKIWLSGFAFGAIVSLILGIVFFNHKSSPDLAQQIANEVVANHIKLKPMEIQSNDFTTVKKYFDLLDFAPVHSKQFSLETKTLLGGRYCSIKTAPAAQLRYRDAQGKLYTLYQTGYDSSLFSEILQLKNEESIISRYAKGMEVTIWLEQGLLIAGVSET